MKHFVKGPQKLINCLQEITREKVSGKFLRRVLEANLCRVNGRIERFASARLQKGDLVELASSWKEGISSPILEFPILYEDDALRFVNKPAGWVCSEENCLRMFGKELYLVHRLDKDTTGVLALAKGLQTREEWMAYFAERAVEKEYVAIVDGVPKKESGVIENELIKKRTFEGQTIWGSGQNGLKATTYWRVLAQGENSALLLCRPITGRTHQIRVHLAEMGHPILIDRQYAARFRSSFFAKRPLLHASRLQIGNAVATAPLPSDMQEALSFCKISYPGKCS